LRGAESARQGWGTLDGSNTDGEGEALEALSAPGVTVANNTGGGRAVTANTGGGRAVAANTGGGHGATRNSGGANTTTSTNTAGGEAGVHRSSSVAVPTPNNTAGGVAERADVLVKLIRLLAHLAMNPTEGVAIATSPQAVCLLRLLCALPIEVYITYKYIDADIHVHIYRYRSIDIDIGR